MEFKKTTAFFKTVLLDKYQKYPAEILEQNSLVNLYVPPQCMGMSSSNFQVGNALIRIAKDTPPTSTRTFHNNELPRIWFWDQFFITKPLSHP